MFQSTMDNAACLFLLLLIPSVLSAEGDPASPQPGSSQPGSSQPGASEAAFQALVFAVAKLQAEKKAQDTELENLRRKVEALSQDKTASQVAFSASLSSSDELTFGPYNFETTLAYKHVVSNIGSAYNSQTGIFTAPVRGVYHFEVHIHSVFRGHPAEVYLMKNGHGTYMTYEQQSNGRGTASNSITLLLEVGDRVYVTLPAKRQIYDNFYHHSTFSGHLLFTM